MATGNRSDAAIRMSASGFTVLVYEGEEDEGGYWGEVVELPGCVSQGDTIDELKANIQEAIEAVRPYSTTTVAPLQQETM
jgi:hypothetical protein